MSKRITIVIETGNAAFEDNGTMTELARILRKLAGLVEQDGLEEMNRLLDINGNLVGYVSVERIGDEV